ncbi:MAG: flagellar basal body P-ring protein FlgI [Pseudomonadota bacterium]
MRFARLFLIFLAVAVSADAAAQSRVKDIAFLQSSRDNQLFGYGLVVGLPGTGDSLRNAPFTETSMRSMLDAIGVSTAEGQARLRNIAAVIVTANLPAYVRHGSRIDVEVSSLGDAESLIGGRLVMTALKGADNQIYAVAQGAVTTGAIYARGQAESLVEGTATSGRIVNGAIVERELQFSMPKVEKLVLQLRNPDFSTAVAVTDAINEQTSRLYGVNVAREVDARTIELTRPGSISTARFIAAVESLPVTYDSPARVVLDENTGTIVISKDVRISPVAISHGSLTVRVTEMPEVSQPFPLSRGETTVVPTTAIQVFEDDSALGLVNGANLEAIVNGLNQLGVGPRDVMAILQALKNSGALQAELLVQ